MQRRDFLRGLGALAGFALIDGIWQPYRKVFALGGIQKAKMPEGIARSECKNWWETRSREPKTHWVSSQADWDALDLSDMPSGRVVVFGEGIVLDGLRRRDPRRGILHIIAEGYAKRVGAFRTEFF